MKLSLKLQDDGHHHHHHQNQGQNHQHRPLLLRAKIPITIFNLPFLSGFSTTTHHPSDLSLSLSTHFHSGPTLKLAYSTSSSSSSTTTTITTATNPPPPLTLTLKSGTGLFGSPNNSPLIISANFSFSPHNANPNPTFSLLFKPQLGSFSLRKTTVSNPNSGTSGNVKPNGDSNAFGFVPLDRSGVFKDFSSEEGGKDSVLKGISVMARTEMPVGKRVSANLRWGVSFPEDFSKGRMMGMPYLSVNKIGIERVDEVKEEKVVKERKNENNQGDVELLKSMCSWMKRELDTLQRENRETKFKLEELKMGHLMRNGSIGGGLSEGVGKKVALPVVENSGGFEQWRNKKNGGEENVKKDGKKNGNRASDVESELQRAIKAASL